jgi:DNA-binding transcriptional ArsR family regulator
MRGRLVVGERAVESEVLPPKSLALLNEDRLRILQALREEPKYPAQVAKELGMHAQTAYYHFRLLEQAGLVRLVEYQERGGAVAKRFQATADALSAVLNERAWKPFAAARRKPPEFLERFIVDGALDAKIVVGSPDPHGKYRAQGSEYCAMELAARLGQWAAFDYPLYYLDTEVKESVKRQNLILFGGPKVNLLVAEVNPRLPVRFQEPALELHSTLSGKSYGEVANVGIVEVVDSPFAKGKKILVIAGTHYLGTRVATLACLRHLEKLAEGNSHQRSALARVVQGFDEDGDGLVDAVEFLE